MKIKRTLLTLMAMVLVCAISITGTLAYLKTATDPVMNTFTVEGLFKSGGKLELYEDPVTFNPAAGKYEMDSNGAGVTSIDYDIYEGMVLQKNPYVQITNKNDVPAWLFVEVVESTDIFYVLGDDETCVADRIGAGSANVTWAPLMDTDGSIVIGPQEGWVFYCTSPIREINGTEKFYLFDQNKGGYEFTVAEGVSAEKEYFMDFGAYMCQATNNGQQWTPLAAFTECFLNANP